MFHFFSLSSLYQKQKKLLKKLTCCQGHERIEREEFQRSRDDDCRESNYTNGTYFEFPKPKQWQTKLGSKSCGGEVQNYYI